MAQKRRTRRQQTVRESYNRRARDMVPLQTGQPVYYQHLEGQVEKWYSPKQEGWTFLHHWTWRWHRWCVLKKQNAHLTHMHLKCSRTTGPDKWLAAEPGRTWGCWEECGQNTGHQFTSLWRAFQCTGYTNAFTVNMSQTKEKVDSWVITTLTFNVPSNWTQWFELEEQFCIGSDLYL